MKNKLQTVDFSQGIKSTEVQHNFEALQFQLDKERRSVAGSGISYGLGFELNDFTLKINEGCLIDKNGEEVYIDTTTIEIDKPILIEKLEKNIEVDAYNRVYLSEIPYATNRLTISENVDIADAGISVIKSGTEDKVPMASIEGRVLNLKPIVGTLAGITVDIKYNYTHKRRDIVYIDKDFKIQYQEGITSPSPSVPQVDIEDISYVLGYIEVNGHALEQLTNETKAGVKVIKEFKSVRNVYTDEDNRLYLCGTPFESLKVIHLVEPTNPEENTFWYDTVTNKLKIWRSTEFFTFSKEFTIETSDPDALHKFTTDVPYLYNANQLSVYVNGDIVSLAKNHYEEGTDLAASQKIDFASCSEFQVLMDLEKGDKVSYRIERTDGYYEWVTINDTSYINIEERFIWNPDEMAYEIELFEHDMRHFYFDAVANKNLLYTPGKNCLEIMINQVPLHSDQFQEITLADAIASEDADMIKAKLVKYYNYTNEFESIEELHEEYENIGIGFKLSAPLDEESFVEVKVSQRVNASPIAKRFQRSATFVDEGSEEYQEYKKDEDNVTIYNPPIFNTTAIYRYDENQLEVFLNGKRLEKDIEWQEVKQKTKSLKAVPCDSFEILPPAGIKNNDRVSYRLTTSIYSYDHVEGLLNNFDVKIDECMDIVKETKKDIDNTKKEVESKISIVEEQIDRVQEITSNLDDTYMSKDQVIGSSNIDASLMAGLMKGSIYQTIQVTTSREYDITNTCNEKDFTLLFNLNDSNGNRILRRGTGDIDEYSITKINGRVKLTLLSSSIQEGHILYLTGIKFGI